MTHRALEHLARYRSLHLNPVNRRLHLVGVPAIVWSLLVLLGQLPLAAGLSLAHVLTGLVGLWYLWLAPGRLGAIAAASMVVLLLLAEAAEAQRGGLILGASVFAAGWVVQFIGHARYERARPAFFTDLRQLVVAPLFVVAELAFLAGWNPAFDAALATRARDLRREFSARRTDPRSSSRAAAPPRVP